MALRKGAWLSIVLGDVVVRGPQYPMPETGDVQSMVCQNCLTDTHKTVFGEIIQFGLIDDQHYLAVRCDKCGEEWTCNFALEHWAYGTIS